MIRPLLLAAALVLPAQGALALSCLPADPARIYDEVAASPESYMILLGTLSFDGSLLPRPGAGHTPQAAGPRPIPARFEGVHLSATGAFDAPLSRSVTLQPVCHGPWCGGLAPGSRVLAFARMQGGDLVIEADPCFTRLFTDPAPAMVETLAACHRDGGCPAP